MFQVWPSPNKSDCTVRIRTATIRIVFAGLPRPRTGMMCWFRKAERWHVYVQCVCGGRFRLGAKTAQVRSGAPSGICSCRDFWLDAVALFSPWFVRNGFHKAIRADLPAPGNISTKGSQTLSQVRKFPSRFLLVRVSLSESSHVTATKQHIHICPTT